MPPSVIDAAQRAQSEGACVVGYLGRGVRALVLHGLVSIDLAFALHRAGFVQLRPRVWCWKTN